MDSQARHSGYPIFLDQVVRVIEKSGNKNKDPKYTLFITFTRIFGIWVRVIPN
jgi:hypothetical protein